MGLKKLQELKPREISKKMDIGDSATRKPGLGVPSLACPTIGCGTLGC